jgi:ABC-2 type transport system permease protein
MSINYFGAWTLLKKEVWRFTKVYHQTLFSPVVNIVLFLAVFSLSIGNKITEIEGVSFAMFVSAGLIMMAAVQNSFANSSSSLVMARVMGYITDYIIAPLGPFELTFGFVLGGVVRGICVACISYLAIWCFVPLRIHCFASCLFFLIAGCLFLSLLGAFCGIFCENFDQMSAMTSYAITPLTFLSGTFYSTNSLPEFWRQVSHFNPFFYMIDGFRFGLTGHHDGNIMIGAAFLVSLNIILTFVVYMMFKTGYRLRN